MTYFNDYTSCFYAQMEYGGVFFTGMDFFCGDGILIREISTQPVDRSSPIK